ncbi:MAG: hypothetical protein KKD94_06005, partial [Nanoarchaeota archaeon]|nr:hypothetical protein [Nanoarchaeota archaeon]
MKGGETMPAAQPKANQTQAQPQVNQTQVQPQVNQTQAQPVQGKQVPVGVKIISVLYYIGAVFGIIFGILFIVGAGF